MEYGQAHTALKQLMEERKQKFYYVQDVWLYMCTKSWDLDTEMSPILETTC